MLTSRHLGAGFPEKSANAITATPVHATASTMATQCLDFLLISFIPLSYYNSTAPSRPQNHLDQVIRRRMQLVKPLRSFLQRPDRTR